MQTKKPPKKGGGNSRPMLIQFELDINAIKEAIANSDYSDSLETLTDDQIAEAVQSGFTNRYWDSDFIDAKYFLRDDPAFKKLMALAKDHQNEYYDRLEYEQELDRQFLMVA